MGMLVDGKWLEDDSAYRNQGGKFVRKATSFHHWIKADGSTPYTPDAGRYHLYVSLACPWAHRTLIFRKLKGLEDVIDLSIVDHFMGKNGWQFGDGPGCIPDPVNNAGFMHQIYAAADAEYTGRVTVPVLWDKQSGTIVNNESSEIIRMLNSEFAAHSNNDYDFYPEDLRSEIDAVNDRVYNTLNNGVYKNGFATTQDAYEAAFDELFGTLDFLEELLDRQRYLAGDRITEADWRLFVTLIRFDAVYVTHFKCNLRRIEDYPNLSNYLRELYQIPGISGTVDMHHIKHHYFGSHESINPHLIVAKGPELDFERPHDRERLPVTV
jgi:glutathionyl-hydroquinone reductase